MAFPETAKRAEYLTTISLLSTVRIAKFLRLCGRMGPIGSSTHFDVCVLPVKYVFGRWLSLIVAVLARPGSNYRH
jgi:hypothetical protein